MGEAILHSQNSQDITNPRIVDVDGYCIRDFQSFEVELSSPKKSLNLAPYEEYDELVNCNEIEDNVDLDVSDTGKFILKFHVPAYFVGYIIGAKGSVRYKIEQDTRTTIKVMNENANNIQVAGSNERDVVTAKNRIDLLIWQARDKHSLTHFVSIPLVTDLIKYNFDSFKTGIISDSTPISGLHPSMFQKPSKIHLTIAPLVLADNVEEAEAIKVLKECNDKVIKPMFANVEPLKVTLHGVEIMNDDPTNVDVLYGKIKIEPPKYNDLLQKMADEIYNYFTNKGLVRKQFDNVKLHATLINSLFRKMDRQNKDEKSTRKTFDATHILKKYKNYYFGDADLNFIHLSIRFTKSESSYYDALTTISIK
ncbi:hypothetical protein RN001_007892 [Aquatica leii]|uniref:K Homology domain-containing protein n=1 Tax=Aquatica leii TaxID=1421715 RepID=A0AAN7PCL0_9COLE|nr:hypothetical protein RN001_007892 [Aquatica leii]